MDILNLQWWMYALFFVSFFVVCLALNYFVKKLNEKRIRDRLVRVQEKASATQTTKANGPTITILSEGEPRAHIVRVPQHQSPPAISLVFDKEENRRIGDVYNLVKPITDLTIDDPYMDTNKSLEKVEIMDIASDRNISECAPIKIIECEPITAKAASSHNFFEKVLVEDKIDSNDPADLIIPKNSKFSELSALDGFLHSLKDCSTLESVPKYGSSNNNVEKVAAKDSGLNITEETIPYEQNNSVDENIPFTSMCSGRIVPTNICIVESTTRNPKVIRDKKNTEKKGCLDSIMSKLTNLRNVDENSRIEKVAMNLIVDKPSSSHTGSIRNVNKSAIEKKESSCNVGEATFCETHSDHVGENVFINPTKSGHIILTETSLDAAIESRVREYLSLRNNLVMNSAYTAFGPVPNNKG